jgi:transcriptional regulator with XRE-family HTH domain
MKKDASEHLAFYQELGANIKKYRNRRKLSQDALAKLISLTRTSLTNIEKGRQHPPVHTLCEIVKQLEVDISELLPRVTIKRGPADLKDVLAGAQVRRDDELAFIKAAIKGEK